MLVLLRRARYPDGLPADQRSAEHPGGLVTIPGASGADSNSRDTILSPLGFRL